MGLVRIVVDGRNYAGVDSEMSARGYTHLVPRGEGDAERWYRLPPGTYWCPEPSNVAEMLEDAAEATASERGVQIIATAGATAWSGLAGIDEE